MGRAEPIIKESMVTAKGDLADSLQLDIIAQLTEVKPGGSLRDS